VLRLLLLFLSPVAAATTTTPPPPALSCLAKYYGVAIERDGATFWVRVDAATRLPWNDGRAKSTGERLDRPDVEDAFAQPYTPGPIRPVTTPDEDPGRVRLDAVLRAAYPARDIIRVDFAGHRVRFAARAAPALARVSARLARAVAADAALEPFVRTLGGTVNERVIAGTHRPSAHSWGIAIDLAPELGDYWRWRRRGAWRNRMPQAIVDAFEAEGFIWGGRWYHYDTMHFEYRPELLDRACR
jgi:hypothetical protein